MDFSQTIELIELSYDSKSSRDSYKSAIRQLHKVLPNFDAINSPQEILDIIPQFSDGIQKHIVNVLRKLTAHEAFREPVKEIKKKIEANNAKRSRPIELDIDSLKKVFKRAKKELSESEKLLYTLLLEYPVLRRGDYYSILFQNYNPETDNYYDRKSGRLVFNSLVKIPLKPGMIHYINLRPADKTLFNKFKGSRLVSGSLSVWEKRIKEINKNIFDIDGTFGIWRKITYTDFSQEFFNELNRFLKVAQSQNHTLNSIISYYLRTF